MKTDSELPIEPTPVLSADSQGQIDASARSADLTESQFASIQAMDLSSIVARIRAIADDIQGLQATAHRQGSAETTQAPAQHQRNTYGQFNDWLLAIMNFSAGAVTATVLVLIVLWLSEALDGAPNAPAVKTFSEDLAASPLVTQYKCSHEEIFDHPAVTTNYNPNQDMGESKDHLIAIINDCFADSQLPERVAKTCGTWAVNFDRAKKRLRSADNYAGNPEIEVKIDGETRFRDALDVFVEGLKILRSDTCID